MYRYVLLFAVMIFDIQASVLGNGLEDGRKTPESNKVIDVATRFSTCSRNKDKNLGNQAGARPRCFSLGSNGLHDDVSSSESLLSSSLEFENASQLIRENVLSSEEELKQVNLNDMNIEKSWIGDDSDIKKKGMQSNNQRGMLNSPKLYHLPELRSQSNQSMSMNQQVTNIAMNNRQSNSSQSRHRDL